MVLGLLTFTLPGFPRWVARRLDRPENLRMLGMFLSMLTDSLDLCLSECFGFHVCHFSSFFVCSCERGGLAPAVVACPQFLALGPATGAVFLGEVDVFFMSSNLVAKGT